MKSGSNFQEPFSKNILLVIGAQRSGTTLIAAMLSRHPEIAMLCEDEGYGVLKNMGHTYSGNKLLAYHQIRFRKRASVLGHAINRIINFNYNGKRHHQYRPEPTSKLSVQDYLNLGAKVICVRRNRQDTINSMILRSNMDPNDARIELKWSYEIMNKIPVE